MVKGNELILDLEKKLNLYSYHTEKEVSYFGNTECKELVDIVFNIYKKKNVSNEIVLFNNKYDVNLIVKNNKICYEKPERFSKIGIEIFERLYFESSNEKSLEKWIQITKLFDNYGFGYWLVDLSKIQEVKEYFLDEIANYIIRNKVDKEDWIKSFEEYDSLKPSYRYFDINKIPKSFNNSFHIYKFFKKNKYEEFLYNPFNTKLSNSFIQCLLDHEVDRGYYYNSDTYSRINMLLTELKDDYSVIGEIFTCEDIRFNTYLLSNSKYCLYGFLNIITMQIHLNNLVNEYGFNYNKQWLDMVSNQVVDIFISTLLNNNKNELVQILFNMINYSVMCFLELKIELLSFSLEDFLNKFGSLISLNDKLLFNITVNDLVEKQIKILEKNEYIEKESYFILNWYLKNLNSREKIDNIDYSKLRKSITKSILQNIKNTFHKSVETKHFYINKSQIIKNTCFELFYIFSLEEIKNNWTNLLNYEQLKMDMKTDNRYYVSDLVNFYLEILILFYYKTYDQRLERTMIDIVVRLGLEEKYGIFFGNNEPKLYDSFLKILNNFEDENYQVFINKIFEIKDIKNILQIYHQTISIERKEILKEKIEDFDFENEEFNSYFDLQESIDYSLNSGFDDLSNKLIDIYKEVLERDKEKSLKRQNLIIDERKDSNITRIAINSNEILNGKILAFQQLKYRKDLIDVYHEKNNSPEEKLKKLNELELPESDKNNYKNREINEELKKYKKFITSLVFLEEKPLVSYKILKELNGIKPSRNYLINMIRAYYEAYKEDKNKKDKIEYIIEEYKIQKDKIDNYEKSLYDYQILLTIHGSINDFKSFVELWNELPLVYYFDIYLAEIRCEFLQKNNQIKELLEYIKKIKKYHKKFSNSDLNKIIELENKIKDKIPIKLEENISVNVILDKPKSIDKYEAENYWNKIKSMDNEIHAYIFGNNQNVEEYIKDIMLNISEELLERKKNLERVNENNNLEYEDIINDWVGSLLTQRKLFLGWNVLDQKRGGVSGTEKGVGEKDLVVKNSKNRNLFLFEAFKNKVEEHLNKLDGYNASGCKLIIVFVYTKDKNFPNYSKKYQEKISNMNYENFDELSLPLNIEKIDSESTKIHLYKDVRLKNKDKTVIYHYLLDFN